MIKAKKSLGQNFLIDKNIAKKIALSANIKKEIIVEIGPGKGILTDEILKYKPKLLILIEKDKNLFEELKNKYHKINNIKIIHEDALYYNYSLIKNKFKVVANLPYNISIKIIIQLLKINKNLSQIVAMIQKDVADKMKYSNVIKKNRLNLFLEISSEYKSLFNVSNKVFRPQPKVLSSVITIKPKSNQLIDLKKFEIFTREIFKFKRKKLSNVLPKKLIKNNSNFILNLDKRAEDMNTEELLNIFKEFYNF